MPNWSQGVVLVPDNVAPASVWPPTDTEVAHARKVSGQWFYYLAE